MENSKAGVRAVSTFLLLVSLLSLATNTWGQVKEELKLSMDDAIKRALAKNLAIQVERYNPEILTTTIGVEQAVFDPIFKLDNNFNTQRLPTASTLTGAVSATETRTVQPSLQQRFITGGNYTLSLNTTRTDTNSRLGFINPNYASELTFTLIQPLLRNFGLDFNRSRIRIARINRDISLDRLRQVVTSIVALVQNSYWDLVLAREIVQVRQQSLERAKDLNRRNKIMIEAGVLAPIEIYQSEAAVASREADFIVAEAAVGDAEDSLRNLVNLEEDFPGREIAITPTDQPVVTVREVSLEESLKEALEKRPEIAQGKGQILTREISARAAKNQVLPSLDFKGTFGFNGLGPEFSDDIDVLLGGRRYRAGAGLVLEIPIFNRAARQSLRRADLEAEQAANSLKQTQQNVVQEVRTSVRRVATNLKRVEATKVARVLAEKKLDAEEKKFRVGLSTSFQILEFQNDLAIAQSEETRANSEYSKSLVELERARGRLLEVHNIILTK